jgi:hypothetical protein
LSCVARFGRFINLARDNLQTNDRLEMAPFAKTLSFPSVDMIYLQEKEHQICRKYIPESDKVRNRAEGNGPSDYKGHTSQGFKHTNEQAFQP